MLWSRKSIKYFSFLSACTREIDKLLNNRRWQRCTQGEFSTMSKTCGNCGYESPHKCAYAVLEIRSRLNPPCAFLNRSRPSNLTTKFETRFAISCWHLCRDVPITIVVMPKQICIIRLGKSGLAQTLRANSRVDLGLLPEESTSKWSLRSPVVVLARCSNYGGQFSRRSDLVRVLGVPVSAAMLSGTNI